MRWVIMTLVDIAMMMLEILELFWGKQEAFRILMFCSPLRRDPLNAATKAALCKVCVWDFLPHIRGYTIVSRVNKEKFCVPGDAQNGLTWSFEKNIDLTHFLRWFYRDRTKIQMASSSMNCSTHEARTLKINDWILRDVDLMTLLLKTMRLVASRSNSYREAT